MKVNYNVTGTDRKVLVTVLGEILDVKPKYLGIPGAAYQVDYFTIDKNGVVEFGDRADSEEIESLLERLADRGFVSEPEPQGENVGFTVEIPLEAVKVGNLATKKDDMNRNILDRFYSKIISLICIHSHKHLVHH